MRDFQARLDYRAVPFLGAAPCRFSSAGVFAEAFFAAIPQALQIARGFCGMPHAQERVGAIQNPARAPRKKKGAPKISGAPRIYCRYVAYCQKFGGAPARLRVRRIWRFEPPRRALTDSLSAPAFRIFPKIFAHISQKTREFGCRRRRFCPILTLLA